MQAESGGRSSYKIYMRNGLLWMIGGGILTLGTYVVAKPGGSYYILWGAIVWGMWTFVRGFIGWRNATTSRSSVGNNPWRWLAVFPTAIGAYVSVLLVIFSSVGLLTSGYSRFISGSVYPLEEPYNTLIVMVAGGISA